MEVDSPSSEDEGPTRFVVGAQIHQPGVVTQPTAVQLETDDRQPENESEVDVGGDTTTSDVNVEDVTTASDVDVEDVTTAADVEDDTSASEGDGGNPVFGDQARLPFEFLSMKPKGRKRKSKRGWAHTRKRRDQDWKRFEDQK